MLIDLHVTTHRIAVFFLRLVMHFGTSHLVFADSFGWQECYPTREPARTRFYETVVPSIYLRTLRIISSSTSGIELVKRPVTVGLRACRLKQLKYWNFVCEPLPMDFPSPDYSQKRILRAPSDVHRTPIRQVRSQVLTI